MTGAPGQIVTFYSYKGGTGRSMALANVAWMLAANGNGVLIIDWDLEAPGLHRYFRPFLSDPEQLETKGLIDVFWDMTAAQVANMAPAFSQAESSIRSEQGGDLADAVIDIVAPPRLAPALLAVTRRLRRGSLATSSGVRMSRDTGGGDLFPGNGYIDFIGAGRQNATYGERVNTFDWRGFYELGGSRLIRDAAVALRDKYQWILIDSRTGVSDTSGICTMEMPDKVVACFTLNRQSISGVASVLGSIRAWRAARPELKPIVLLPLAMRIENAEAAQLALARKYGRDSLLPYLPQDADDQRAYWDEMEITYWPRYAYAEILAPFVDKSGAEGTSKSLLSEIEKLARMVVYGPSANPGKEKLRAPEVLPDEQLAISRQYAFNDSAPAQQDSETPDVSDQSVLRDIYRKESIWRENNRHYRWLLSRGQLDFLTEPQVAQFGTSMLHYVKSSTAVQAWFRTTIEKYFIILAALIFASLGIYVIDIRLTALRPIAEPPLAGGFPLWATIVIAIPVIWFSAGLLTFIWNIIVDRSLGNLSPVQMLELSLRGPFQPVIQDNPRLQSPP